jgi:hypothetical protein
VGIARILAAILVARALLLTAGMRGALSVIVLLGVATLAGCGTSSLTGSTGLGGSTGTGGTPTGGSGGGGSAGGSPGTITFMLTTPSSVSFCDQLTCGGGNQHLSIFTADGTELSWPAGSGCGVDCASCSPMPCPQIAILCPASEGVAYTGGTLTWDGSFTATSSCGTAHTTCTGPRYAAPGSYVAKFCATVGTVSQPDAGLPVCSSTYPTVCTEATFQYPAAGTVLISLPAGPFGLD